MGLHFEPKHHQKTERGITSEVVNCAILTMAATCGVKRQLRTCHNAVCEHVCSVLRMCASMVRFYVNVSTCYQATERRLHGIIHRPIESAMGSGHLITAGYSLLAKED